MASLTFLHEPNPLFKYVAEISEPDNEGLFKEGDAWLIQRPNRSVAMCCGIEQVIIYARNKADAEAKFRRTKRYLELLTYGAVVTIRPAE